MDRARRKHEFVADKGNPASYFSRVCLEFAGRAASEIDDFGAQASSRRCDRSNERIDVLRRTLY